MTQRSETGKIGEDLACDYLRQKGYHVIERNARKPWGELDIVAVDPDKTLVFIEVKTMKSSDSAQGLRPEDQMTAAKLKKFKRTASLYAGEHPELVDDNKGWRLDLIAILLDKEGKSLEHYKNIE